MEARMWDPMGIDPSLIPAAETQNLAMTLLAAMKRFYEDPAAMAEFREWKIKKEAEAKC